MNTHPNQAGPKPGPSIASRWHSSALIGGLLAALLMTGAPALADEPSPERHADFARQLDLAPLSTLAVFDNGRAKILQTLAREHLQEVYGKTRWSDRSLPENDRYRYDPVFTLLDFTFRPDYYLDRPLIHVEVLELRRNLVAWMPPDQQESWLRSGRLAPHMFARPEVRAALSAADADLRLIKARNQVLSAINAFSSTSARLTLVSPAPASDRWTTLADSPAAGGSAAPEASGAGTPAADPGQAAEAARRAWADLRTAWLASDANAANRAVLRLAQTLPVIHPQSYPPAWRRSAEHLYNLSHQFTLGFLAYAAALVLLLIGMGSDRRAFFIAGSLLLTLGLMVHLAAVLVRGLLAGRIWAIHNQYESFIAIALFAVAVGLVVMLLRRQLLFGAAAAAVGTASLLFANTVDIPSEGVAPVAGILATSRILYIHVNLVLASYGLIGLGFFISLFYLAAHYLRSPATTALATTAPGTTASAVGVPADPENAPARPTASLMLDLDHAQMVVLQLAFWVLGVGILLGAYWADHAWGRWWAWDPKETWALITWIVYLIVIHLRHAVRRRGLVTAWLSVLGFFVMLWTYWGVNLLLAGLHSYA